MEFLIIIAVIVLFLLFSNGFFDGDKQQQKEFEVKRKNDMLEYERLQEEARRQEEERQQEETYRQKEFQEHYSEELEDNSDLRSEEFHRLYDKYEGLSDEEAYAQSESEDDYD
jgi:FtsZ-interacting cell division protein ZipA